MLRLAHHWCIKFEILHWRVRALSPPVFVLILEGPARARRLSPSIDVERGAPHNGVTAIGWRTGRTAVAGRLVHKEVSLSAARGRADGADGLSFIRFLGRSCVRSVVHGAPMVVVACAKDGEGNSVHPVRSVLTRSAQWFGPELE